MPPRPRLASQDYNTTRTTNYWYLRKPGVLVATSSYHSKVEKAPGTTTTKKQQVKKRQAGEMDSINYGLVLFCRPWLCNAAISTTCRLASSSGERGEHESIRLLERSCFLFLSSAQILGPPCCCPHNQTSLPASCWLATFRCLLRYRHCRPSIVPSDTEVK